MRILPITFAFMFFTPLLGIGQNVMTSIKSKAIKSDSILILSHENLLSDAAPGKSGIHRQVVTDDIPNKSIIKEQVKLDNSSKELLVKLFKGMKRKRSFHPPVCFEPHHSILFFENGKCSYVDICFGCRGFRITRDLVVDKNFLASDKDWKSLELFFIDRKFNYKIKEH